MYYDNDPITNLHQLAPSTPVYDVNGDKVGTIENVDPQSNLFVIQKGLFFPKDITVPLSAIARTDADGVYLNLSKDDVSSGNFGAAYAGPGMAPTEAVGTQTAQQVPQTQQTGDMAVPVREEELLAGKQQEEQGRVRVRKHVVEEPQSLTVPVTHEELRVERRPVDQPAEVASDTWQEQAIDVPLRGEELVAEKRPRVTEEVHIEKQPVTEQREVRGTVRKERVRLENEGDVAIERADDLDLDQDQP